jgi:hypothetical protein
MFGNTDVTQVVTPSMFWRYGSVALGPFHFLTKSSTSIVEVHCAIFCACAASSKPFIQHHFKFLRPQKSKKTPFIASFASFRPVGRAALSAEGKTPSEPNSSPHGQADLERDAGHELGYTSPQVIANGAPDQSLYEGSEMFKMDLKQCKSQSQEVILEKDHSLQKHSNLGGLRSI